MLSSLTEKSPLAPDVSLSSLATQTAALVAKDLVDLVARTGVMAMNRVHTAL
jgi:peroxin-6